MPGLMLFPARRIQLIFKNWVLLCDAMSFHGLYRAFMCNACLTSITYINKVAVSFRWRHMALGSIALLTALDVYISSGGAAVEPESQSLKPILFHGLFIAVKNNFTLHQLNAVKPRPSLDGAALQPTTIHCFSSHNQTPPRPIPRQSLISSHHYRQRWRKHR